MSNPSATTARDLTSTIERRGLRDHVYDRVLEMLLSGRAEPGTRLSINALALQLDVSPTPVREAMVELERTGLVTREALRGYRVAPPFSSAQLAELMEARLMLETTAARLAFPADGPMLVELNEAEERHRESGAQVMAGWSTGENDVALTTQYFASDMAFHDVIFRHCGNHYVLEMSRSLGAQLHRMRQSAKRGVDDVEHAIREHTAIVTAYESGIVGAPEAAMRTHIESVRARSLAADQREHPSPHEQAHD